VRILLLGLVGLFEVGLWVMFAYQAVLARWGWSVRPGPAPSEAQRFAVLIPAHDEEAALGSLLASLAAADYPALRLFVLVVADHCSDGTARVARAAGVACLERADGAPGKAAALADGLAWLESERPGWADGVAFFDADNVVDAAFFRYAAGRLAAGAPVVQGHVGIANHDVTLFARLNWINAMAENRFKELARGQAGLSCQLRGHGMVFRGDLLKRVEWHADSLAEDKGMVVRLVLAGLRVVWEDRARVASVLPTNTRDAAAQRRRWAGGKAAVASSAVGPLWRKWRESGDPVAFDLMVDFLMPSHAVQLSLVFGAVVVAGALADLQSGLFLAALALVPAYLAYFYLAGRRAGVPGRAFLSVFAAPIYILWRTWINLTRRSGARRWR
jgi:cellulose synthase/poly-beta-1,6-N-acetylglucosamine synthase-like glycosyltransferase